MSGHAGSTRDRATLAGQGGAMTTGGATHVTAIGGASLGGAGSVGASPDSVSRGGQSTIVPSAQGGKSGQAALEEPRFANVVRVATLASEYEDDNPTLTANQLELYFSSKNRPGGKGNVDVWVAKRTSASAEFGTPQPVLSVSTEGIDSSPAVSANGLTLWVGFDPGTKGLGGYDIMQATRASTEDDFGTPVLVPDLSSNKDDIPRPLGNHDLTMPLASRRDSDIYLTFFASRTSATARFDVPRLMPELIDAGKNVADAFLSDDGLTVYFARSLDSRSDLFVAHRASVDLAFGTAVPLSTINSDYDDRDPWLSPDGKVLYFSSDRHAPGTLNIYQANRVVP